MNRFIVFGGTTEGRWLSEWMCRHRILHTLCVATEYGEQVLENLQENPYVTIHMGRMDVNQMKEVFCEWVRRSAQSEMSETEWVRRSAQSEVSETEGVSESAQSEVCVIDATHPYALVVSENIRKACSETGAEYIRVCRNSSTENGPGHNSRFFRTTEECAQFLLSTEGRIFLTTGSKELAVFAGMEELRERLVVRVLPGRESIALCEEAGIPGKRIVAMQGPFSQEMNEALLRAYDARILVTKDSGKAGGFLEKIQAAEAVGCSVYIIGRPTAEDGISYDEVCETIGKRLGMNKAEEENASDESLQISLIGCGMGHRACLTVEALHALEQANIVFGARRLLADMEIKQVQYPYYLSRDIIPILQETMSSYRARGKKVLRAAILFSGDTGFCSGAKKMQKDLALAVDRGLLDRNKVEVYPGISSVSALAALLGESWDDARIMSVHGKGEPSVWGAEVMAAVEENAKTFLLLSGVKDLHAIAEMILERYQGNEAGQIRIRVGYQLSSPQQEVLDLTPEECLLRQEEGLYILMIENPAPVSRCLTHGLADDAFIRGKVPMTKEEVRTVSISRLHLQENSVVYDIGSGTGSIAVEMARLSPKLQIYAIERKKEAVELIRQNAARFHLRNLHVVEGFAPEALEGLPAPTHAFIGGTGGHMKDILNCLADTCKRQTENLCQKGYSGQNGNEQNGNEQNGNEQNGNGGGVHIVANAVSFETLQEILEVPQQYQVEDFQVTTLQATRTKKLGSYHMQQAENPVWISSWVMR